MSIDPQSVEWEKEQKIDAKKVDWESTNLQGSDGAPESPDSVEVMSARPATVNGANKVKNIQSISEDGEMGGDKRRSGSFEETRSEVQPPASEKKSKGHGLAFALISGGLVLAALVVGKVMNLF